VFDPMDFTPMVLDRVPGIERRTSSAFELALSVLFTSGIQHYAEIPAGMANAPDYVREFLKGVPSVWDDVKFIAGFPGQFAVIARQGNGKWYVAGINADTKDLDLSLSLADVPVHGTGMLIGDGASGGTLSFRRETLHLSTDKRLPVKVKGRGGFVIVFE
jgi:hypothetical protein